MNDIARVGRRLQGHALRLFREQGATLRRRSSRRSAPAMSTMIFDFDHEDADIEAVLTRIGTQLAAFLADPGYVSAMRVVMGIAERMPELGRRFTKPAPAKRAQSSPPIFDRASPPDSSTSPTRCWRPAQFLELSHAPLVQADVLRCATDQPSRSASARSSPPRCACSWPPTASARPRRIERRGTGLTSFGPSCRNFWARRPSWSGRRGIVNARARAEQGRISTLLPIPSRGVERTGCRRQQGQSRSPATAS